MDLHIPLPTQSGGEGLMTPSQNFFQRFAGFNTGNRPTAICQPSSWGNLCFLEEMCHKNWAHSLCIRIQ